MPPLMCFLVIPLVGYLTGLWMTVKSPDMIRRWGIPPVLAITLVLIAPVDHATATVRATAAAAWATVGFLIPLAARHFLRFSRVNGEIDN